MGEENFRNNGDNKKSNITVVLKADLHFDGCAAIVIKCIRSYDGVDPAKFRDRVEQNSHKKLELISPQPKKDGGDSNVQKKPKEKEVGVVYIYDALLVDTYNRRRF